MAIKLVDELRAMGNFPIAHAEGINLVKKMVLKIIFRTFSIMVIQVVAEQQVNPLMKLLLIMDLLVLKKNGLKVLKVNKANLVDL